MNLLDDLYTEYSQRFEGNEFVFGCGCTEPKLLLIGEAPGREEVKLSRPFSGAAGKNLDEFLELVQIQREKIFITNTIKYRLSKVSPKTGRLSNRPATRDEINNSRPFLLREIEIISPKVIVTLGNIPLRAVTGNMAVSIGECHGKALENTSLSKRYVLFPLYHPASIIYNRSLKQVYEGDILALRGMLDNLNE